MSSYAVIASNETGPTEVIQIDEDRCIGCNRCANICRTQTILINPVQGKAPLLVYPDECWFCACCVEVCPTGALQMRQPVGRRILFKRKETGEIFRIGQKNPPAKSFFRPAYGELHEEKTELFWKELGCKDKKHAAVLTQKTIDGILEKFSAQGHPGRLAALLRNMGFDYVLKEETFDASDTSAEGCVFAYFGEWTEETLPDAWPEGHIYNLKDLGLIIHRSCISMYTAVHVWDDLPDREFDMLKE